MVLKEEEGGVCFEHCLRASPVTAKEPLWQCIYNQEEEWSMKAISLQSSVWSPMPLMLLPSLRVGLPSPVKPLLKTPHGHTQSCISMVTLSIIRLTMAINHHSCPC